MKLRATLLLAAVFCVLFAHSMPDATPAPQRAFRLLNLDGNLVRWRMLRPGAGTRVTYALITGPQDTPQGRNCRNLVPVGDMLQRWGISMADFRREVHEAFHMWEEVADISFEETSRADAQITIGALAVGYGHAFADVSYAVVPASTMQTITSARVCLNPLKPWKIGYGGRKDIYDLRYTIAHEIGHAIGLDHPARPGQLMFHEYDESLLGLQHGDIEGAVELYGLPRQARG